MSDRYRPPYRDERLVMFLQQFRPSAPPTPLDSEERLFLLLDRPSTADNASEAPVTRVRPWHRSWRRRALPAGILALGSVLLAWGGHRLSAPQMALESPPEELEEFIVRSWEGFTPTPTDTLRTFEAEWLLRDADASPANPGVRAEPASVTTYP